MDDSRRSFMKITGLAALGLGATSALDVMAAGGGSSEPQPRMLPNEKALTAKRWAMVIDTRKIHSSHDLEPMIEACHSIHNVPKFQKKNHEIKWLWEEEYKHAFSSIASDHVPKDIKHKPFLVLCNHCENPPCVRACPTKATFKRESDGIVLMDFHRCIGCRFCMAACPFGARSFNFREPKEFIPEVNLKFPRRTRGVVEKCNFCAERLAVGKLPACAEVSKGIITFGDLDDKDSDVSKLIAKHFTIRRKQTLGTEPSVFYIV